VIRLSRFTKKNPPHGFDDENRPIWGLNAKLQPICGSNRTLRKTGKVCQSRGRMRNGRCNLCGGATPSGMASANYKHGMRSQESLTRKAIMNALANFKELDSDERDLLDQAIATVGHHIKLQNFEAAKWLIDQLAGTAKTTIKTEIADDSVFAAIVDEMSERGIAAELIVEIMDGVGQRLLNDGSGSGSEGQGAGSGLNPD
jgi:hypothetical protein